MDQEALVSRDREAGTTGQPAAGRRQSRQAEEKEAEDEPPSPAFGPAVLPPKGGRDGRRECFLPLGGRCRAQRGGGGLAPLLQRGGETDDASVSSPPWGEVPSAARAEGAESPAELADVTFAEFQAAWPAIVARIRSQFGARRHAFVKVAEPLSVEKRQGRPDASCPPALPPRAAQRRTPSFFHLSKTSPAEILGGTIALEFQADDGAAGPSETEPERAPDKDRLVEEGSARDDPADLIADMLGGEVVSE